MAEVIYTRESVTNTHDGLIEELMNEIIKRPLFLNHALHRDNILQSFGEEVENAEIVGSSIDGTKLGKVFDIGDYDMLIFSPNLTFDVDDELLFEYRNDDPYFLRIPQPKQLENKTQAVDGVYMSAHDLRFFSAPLFRRETLRNYATFPYDLVPTEEVTSLYKCATTTTTPYTDPVGEKCRAPPNKSMNSLTHTLWNSEHILLTYMMHRKNEHEFQFVRELLFDDLKGDCESLKEALEFSLSCWKEDMQKTLFSNFDIVYFKEGDFRKRLESVCQQGETQFGSAMETGPHGEYSTDKVPAIKCSGWPRPAMAWMDRPRQWPGDNVVVDIVSSGFQLVAKSPPINPTPEKDFILSFSQSEIKLIQALPITAKIAYRLLKLCYKAIKADVSDGPTLKSFHLKSALFWVAEQTPPEMWESKGILWGIRAIINFLLSKLEQGHLPAFFIPESNLIPHFRVYDIKRLSGILRSIHENPACYIQLMMDKEIDFMRNTMPCDSFNQFFDPGYLESFSWSEYIKISVYACACADGYPIDQIFDNTSQIQTGTFYDQFINCLNSDERSNTVQFTINDSQLKYVDLFAKTVTSFKMDLFNVFDREIDSSMLDLPMDWINDLPMKLYPSYDKDEDNKFGEFIYNALKLRLKYYGNIFHALCCKLFFAVDCPGILTGNQDFNNIVMFLNKLKQKYNYSDENIEDLLHYLFYFCHFTRLRHHSLPIDKQILRSICEFLQNAQILMTVYFNPKAIYPRPVVSDNISLLEELNA